MSKALLCALVLATAATLAACNKTSEDHAQDAQVHSQKAQEKAAEGKVERASQEQAKAQEDRAQANDAAATEGRNTPPDSAVPGYIKTPSKANP
jgi:predicted small secreted protein